jgi:hypothetical protein
MRDDLLDTYAAADWAITHLDGFKQRLEAWINGPHYSVIEEPHSEMGQKLLKLRIDDPSPLTSTLRWARSSTPFAPAWTYWRLPSPVATVKNQTPIGITGYVKGPGPWTFMYQGSATHRPEMRSIS